MAGVVFSDRLDRGRDLWCVASWELLSLQGFQDSGESRLLVGYDGDQGIEFRVDGFLVFVAGRGFAGFAFRADHIGRVGSRS